MKIKFSKPERSTAIIASITIIALILFFYKAFTGPKLQGDYVTEYYNEKTTIGLISPFKDKQEESQYQTWYIGQRKKGIPDSTLQRKQFDHFYKLK